VYWASPADEANEDLGGNRANEVRPVWLANRVVIARLHRAHRVHLVRVAGPGWMVRLVRRVRRATLDDPAGVAPWESPERADVLAAPAGRGSQASVVLAAGEDRVVVEALPALLDILASRAGRAIPVDRQTFADSSVTSDGYAG